MFVVIDSNVHRLGYPVSPFELDVLDNTWCKTLAPAWIDRELPTDPGKFENALVSKAGLFA